MRNKYLQRHADRIHGLIKEEDSSRRINQSEDVYTYTMMFRHSVESAIARYVRTMKPLIGESLARHEVARSLLIYVESNDRSLVRGVHPPHGL